VHIVCCAACIRPWHTLAGPTDGQVRLGTVSYSPCTGPSWTGATWPNPDSHRLPPTH